MLSNAYILIMMMVMLMFVDNYDDDNVVLTIIWIVTWWLCGRKYLIMQLLLELINVNGGDLLHCGCWIHMRCFCIVESFLVCPCIIVILSLRMFTSSSEIWILCVQWFRIFISSGEIWILCIQWIWCFCCIMRWRPLLLVTVPHASRRV